MLYQSIHSFIWLLAIDDFRKVICCCSEGSDVSMLAVYNSLKIQKDQTHVLVYEYLF